MKNFHLEKKHGRDCEAVAATADGRWDSPWYFPVGERAQWRDALGRKNGGSHRWLTLLCNNTQCDGRAIVREGAITTAAAQWEQGE